MGASDRGQAVPLLVAAVAFIAVAAVLIGRIGVAVVQAAQARTAADAAALAGAHDGARAAAVMAGANGGTLVSYIDDGSTVTVVVRVGRAEAAARATLEVVVAAPGERGSSLYNRLDGSTRPERQAADPGRSPPPGRADGPA